MSWASIVRFVRDLFGLSFQDTDTSGIPNLEEFAPGLWRMGQPKDAAAWTALKDRIDPLELKTVVVVKLNDDREGIDVMASVFYGWSLSKFPIPPEDDKPWTVLQKPDPKTVNAIVDFVLSESNRGHVVVIHCAHGRDRTSLVAALVQKRRLGWTKAQMERDMTAHGFRWALPDLALYVAEDT